VKKITIILLFTVTFLQAQKITILNKKTNELISNVTVSSSDNKKHFVSDIDGIVDLSSFSLAEKLLFNHISFTNFNTTKKEILITKKVYLIPLSNALEEVFLSASKKEV